MELKQYQLDFWKEAYLASLRGTRSDNWTIDPDTLSFQATRDANFALAALDEKMFSTEEQVK